jgi:asparagine synthase (glutamine-hydrolysing)
MSAALAHRGPDDCGSWIGLGVCLAHRRLNIVDVKGGHQPMHSADGRLTVVFNGEIYNYPQLRETLEASGRRFQTNCDTEVLLHLYEAHGPDLVTHLRGMFAFGLWDACERSLFLARDHMGQKPLFFHQRGDLFAFASEPKALLVPGLVEPEPDLNGLWHYVSLRYMPDRYSMFRGIEKLPAGTWLRYRFGKCEYRTFWQPDFRTKHVRSESELVDQLDALLQRTTKDHLLSDVPVGAFLSGGIDSGTVTAMMAGATGESFPAFSIGVEEQKFNEIPLAESVANKYGLTHRSRIVKADLIHLIPAMVHYMDEPADPFAAGVYLVSQVAAQEVKVVLGGDGGDENFAGYDRYAGQRVVDCYRLLPHWFRQTVMTRLVARMPQSFGYKSVAQKAAWLNDLSFFKGGERYAQSLSYLRFTQEAKEQLFTPDVRRSIHDADSTRKILAHFCNDRAEHPVDRMLYTDLMTRMPDHLLSLVDRMSMAHSIEVRSPLIDHEVVEFAAGIPAETKIKHGRLKHVLKCVAARHLPNGLIDQPKRGFGFPLAIWMRDELSAFLRRLFAQSRFVELGIFDGDYMRNILEAHLAGKADHNFRLWLLVNLEVWYRMAFEKQSIASMRCFMDELMAV